MERVTSAEPLRDRLRDGVLALGHFDGFHRGHQAVVARARARAGAMGRPLIVTTFDPHPVRVLQPDAEPFELTTLDQRERLFRRSGADAMLMLNFDAAMAEMAPAAFVDLLAALTATSHMVVGRNFSHVHLRTEKVATLLRLAEQQGIGTELVEPAHQADGIISSARIREALRAGDCAQATVLLSRPFTVANIVQHGHKLGRTIGFPTANLLMAHYPRPKYGVYAVRGQLPGGRVIDGVANLGVRPIIEPPEELLEPHFFDFTGDLYDQMIEAELIRYLRPEEKSSGLDGLVSRIQRDCESARAVLAETPHAA